MKNLKESASLRIARFRRMVESRPVLRWLNGRTAVTLALGTALSIGGTTDLLHDVHFQIRKDLDAVRLVKQDGTGSRVVAKVNDGFAANSLFKLSRVFPDSVVSQHISLFDGWLPAVKADTRRDVFHREMARINDAIRREFFAGAMPFGDIIHEKARKYDVDPALVAAVMETESRFRKNARSQVGAQGLMQLMPRTGRWMGADNLYDPEQNVEAGVKYLKYLQGRFNGDLTQAIAAYNAGEGNVRRYGGVPPFRETRSYVQKVFSKYQQRSQQLKDFDGGRSAADPDATALSEDGVTR